MYQELFGLSSVPTQGTTRRGRLAVLD